MSDDTIECAVHGTSRAAFVCQHLTSDASGVGFNVGYDPDEPLQLCPDAWCDACEAVCEAEGEWNDRSQAAAKIKVICQQCYIVARQRNWPEADQSVADYLHERVHDLQHKQARLFEEFRIDDWERFDWQRDEDSGTGKLVFSHQGVERVIADVVFVGSYSSKAGTWMWAWGNSSFSDAERRRLLPVKKHGESLGSMKLASGSWQAEEGDGWDMAAFAVDVLDAVGSYRSPSDNGHLYMAIMSARFADSSAVVSHFDQ